MANSGISDATREKLTLDRMGRCKHFTGLFAAGMKKNRTCEAGVAYDDVHVSHEPIAYVSRGITYKSSKSLPCVDSLNQSGVLCAKREVMTRAEAENEVAQLEVRMGFSNEAHRRAHEASKGVRGGAGTIECPKCGGKLYWSKAASNGHVWGRCETPNCIAWMQ